MTTTNKPNGGGNGVQGITETDIANYLANTPGFFERHAELLASVQLASPHGQRAVSLQERQMQMLRERIKGLEMKIVEMIRNSQDNVAIADRLQRWTRTLMLTTDALSLPQVLVGGLQHEFLIPQAALRLWGADAAFVGEAFAGAVSDDVKSFADSLTLPYCGVNAGFEAVQWLDDAKTVMSVALIPLRHGSSAFGLLALGSPDATRYAADMGTEFLMRIGEVASAALSRLLPAPPPRAAATAAAAQAPDAASPANAASAADIPFDAVAAPAAPSAAPASDSAPSTSTSPSTPSAPGAALRDA